MAQRFTGEDIAKIAPNYKGKVEKFDPSKINSRKGKAALKQNKPTTSKDETTTSQTKAPPKVLTLPKPMLGEQNKTATGQRNESIRNFESDLWTNRYCGTHRASTTIRRKLGRTSTTSSRNI